MVKMTVFNNQTRYAEFVADSDDEISKLPDTKERGKDDLSPVYGVCPGSICRITTNMNIYNLVGEGNYWQLISTGGGGGGGGGTAISIKNVKIQQVGQDDNIENHLIVTLTDESTIDAGVIETVKGDDGFSPSIVVAKDTDDEYILDITTKDGTITTPDLKIECDDDMEEIPDDVIQGLF